MADDDDFVPHLGRMRAGGGKGGRRYLHQVLAAATLARGGPLGGRRTGSASGSARIGRGAGYGAVLARRDVQAAVRARRVVVKTRIVKLGGKGYAAARAHLRYIQRDGVTREGEPGRIYGPAEEATDAKAFHGRADGDRHQFRFIVSAEDGAEYDDLQPLTRRLMARMEADLGTRLDWVAVDHFNTGHPHTHIIVRGKDDRGRDLVIAPDYLTHGIRERAAELVGLDLGPRSHREIERALSAEVEQERLTSIDRQLLRECGPDRTVVAAAPEPFRHTLRTGRLAKLERLGLAQSLGGGRWGLEEGLEDTLRRMGERGDILKTMQREIAAKRIERAPADWGVFEPGSADARPLTGRLIGQGLSDELADRHYLIVDALDGRSHYVDIGAGHDLEPIPDGAIVRLSPVDASVRAADRTIAAVAAANGGVYDVDAHLRHDPNATQAFAETHVRRLEAMRRETGAVERLPDGRWQIEPDHLARAALYAERVAARKPVTVEILSAIPVEKQVDIAGATWLDRDMVATEAEPVRDAGFGQTVRAAQLARRQWLIDNELADAEDGRITYRANLLAILQRRELLRVGAQMSEELGLRFVETGEGQRVAGTLVRHVDLASGRFAVVQKAKEFTLVPWRPVLERHVGKELSGVVRGDGVSWSFGRSRGPSI
ncbi:relaxase/mobilization nuclease RlxS [Sphingomonas sp. UYEF23]|uniref:relaxase/mobilization nuclease RlxS n=1 Tax=Sphingomonas sp. UYEF23 TaxID=1756408 RepID=UPI00339346CD